MKQQLYMMVKDSLEDKIKTNFYSPGDKLPTENELCEIYNVGKATIRYALNILSEMGYIYSLNRIGYFVSEIKNDEYILKFDEANIGEDFLSESKILFTDIIDTSSITFENNNLPHDSKSIMIGRIFYYLTFPVCYQEKYLLYSKQFKIKNDNIFDENFSNYINELILNYSVKRKITVNVISSSDMKKNFLKIDLNEPVMLIKQVYLDKYDHPLGYCFDYYRYDFAKLNAETK